MQENNKQNRYILQRLAREAMIERGLIPDFPSSVISEINALTTRTIKELNGSDKSIRDLRNLLWSSIDNEDSRDLDQLAVAITMPDSTIKILVAIADVDVFVKKDSEIDKHASKNTTSVYTSVQIFPMLPEELSTDLTSLNYHEDRLAIVFEMTIAENGSLQNSEIYRGIVHNHAKLDYNSVSQWLEGKTPVPKEISDVTGLDVNILQQYNIAKKLKSFRNLNGALNFDRTKARPVFQDDNIKIIDVSSNNSSKEMIEDFMIAVNGISARFLESKKFSSIRRVVRTPKRWNKIVEIALAQKYTLPEEPDSKSLDDFLIWSKNNDPIHFADLSLSIIKLLGPGEYVVEIPGDESMGHFGLAVKDYAHSTAPNRRYPDILTQRLLKAAIKDQPAPYSNEELSEFAMHCTNSENAAKKVERQVEKSTFILLLESKIGEEFDSIVTGASSKGVWVRIVYPSIDGKLMNATKDIDVGDKIRVKLVDTDVEKGFIDFVQVG